VKLDLARINERTIALPLRGWPRIISSAHRATPCDTGYGTSRFSSPSRAYKVLYAAQDFRTAFSEAVIRDRFKGRTYRRIYLGTLEDRWITEIGSRAPLSVLDFRGEAAHELGIDTDAKGARSFDEGQKFAEALRVQMTDLDGILYESRLTGSACIAVFDRAFGKLTASSPVEMMRLADFWAEKDRRKFTIVRRRGISPTLVR
jgi:hypothetical protein